MKGSERGREQVYVRQKEKERIPLNDRGVNEARKFAREERMKRKIRENGHDGRQEIYAKDEMASAEGEKSGNQGMRARETALYRAGSGSLGVDSCLVCREVPRVFVSCRVY